MHPVALARVAHKCAQQRWSALLTRIARDVRPALGDMLWADFVTHTEAHYKAKFVAAFRKPVLRCVGTNHGAPCPQAFEVDLTTRRTFADREPRAGRGRHLRHVDVRDRLAAARSRLVGTTVWMATCSAISCSVCVTIRCMGRACCASAAVQYPATSRTCHTTVGCVTCALAALLRCPLSLSEWDSLGRGMGGLLQKMFANQHDPHAKGGGKGGSR